MHRVDLEPQPLVGAPTSAESQESGPPWWHDFEDPVLAALIEQGLSANLDVREGLERIEQAGAFLRQAGAGGRPELGIELGATRDWEKLLNPPDVEEDELQLQYLDGGESDSSSGGGEASGGESAIDTESWETAYDVGLAFRWELDLWGKFRSLRGARLQELQASIHDYEALRLALSRQIADAYFSALEQRQRLQLLEAQRKLGTTLQELLELRLLQGGATSVDVLQQRSQVAEIDAEVPTVRSALGALENRLDVLLGVLPDGQDRTASESLLPMHGIATASIPANLLIRRPDLQAAQRRLVADDFEVAAAVAERYPAVTLTGSFSYMGIEEGDRLLGGSAAAGLLQPLLDWGQRKAAVEAAKSEFRANLLAFSSSYLVAIEEVETTLWQLARQVELLDALSAREAILSRTAEEARVRYGLGVSDYLPVLTALNELNSVQRELLSAQLDKVLLEVRLRAAAGGSTRAE